MTSIAPVSAAKGASKNTASDPTPATAAPAAITRTAPTRSATAPLGNCISAYTAMNPENAAPTAALVTP